MPVVHLGDSISQPFSSSCSSYIFSARSNPVFPEPYRVVWKSLLELSAHSSLFLGTLIIYKPMHPLLVTVQDECLGAAEVWLRALWYQCVLTFIIVPWTCSETLQGLPVCLSLHPLVPSSLLSCLLSCHVYFTHMWGETHNIVFYPLLVLHGDQFILP